MFRLFRDALHDIFGLYDLIWIGLAAAAAWIGLQADDEPQTAPARRARAASAPGRAARADSRNPVDRLTQGLPHGMRITIDWIVTIAGAIAIVLAIKAWVVNPYRIPSSSMEPTLHCAKAANGCEARFSDRVLANRFIYRFTDPERGDIVVFETPPAARARCGAGGTFVKRLIGLPGERLELRTAAGLSYVFINGKKLDEPYIGHNRRDTRGPETFHDPPGAVLHDGRQPLAVVRLAGVGDGAAQEPDREGLRHLLAAEQDLGSVSFRYHCRAAYGPPFAMSTIIESIEQRQLRKDVPRFKAGDTLRVHFQVIEGQRRRVQVFEGIVIKRQGSGVRETFTVRKQSFGVGVERTFPVHSPKIEKIEVAAIGDVNRAKLYYLREKVGKKARVRELRQTPAQVAAAKAEADAIQAEAAAELAAQVAAEEAATAAARQRRRRKPSPRSSRSLSRSSR